MLVKVIGVLVGLVTILQNTTGNQVAPPINDQPSPKPCGCVVIRPKKLPKPVYNLPLYGPPGKGPCIRRTAIVKPAVVPGSVYDRPNLPQDTCIDEADIPAAAAAARKMLKQLSPIIDNPPSRPNYQPIDVSKVYQEALSAGTKTCFPADPVSLALAYKMYHSDFGKKICEDCLSYGFRKLPLEKSTCSKANTPSTEGNLYSYNGEVVELKNEENSPLLDSLSAEAMEELVDLACEEEMPQRLPPKPSLTQIGFKPEKQNTGTFVELPPMPSSDTSSSEEQKPREREKPKSPLPPPTPSPCKSCFKSGDVIFKDIKSCPTKEGCSTCGGEPREDNVEFIPSPTSGSCGRKYKNRGTSGIGGNIGEPGANSYKGLIDIKKILDNIAKYGSSMDENVFKNMNALIDNLKLLRLESDTDRH